MIQPIASTVARWGLAVHVGLAACLAACLATPSAAAKDVVLTIGGGSSAMGNQVSLEKNVLFLQRMLGEQWPDGLQHDIYFSDGRAPEPDVQYYDMSEGVPWVNRTMAQLFSDEDYLGMRYRTHQIPHVRGASTRRGIEQWFRDVGAKLEAGDRLLLYVTAHGGESKEKHGKYNCRLHLWDDEEIDTRELALLLDGLPQGVDVVTVMVQCYSGGFSHLIFNEANAKSGLNPRKQCGFFATRHDRPAAGCTADVNEADYQEYSSFFWAALWGTTRTGEPIDPPDYDGNGSVSFEEAHAYTVIASDSIDIPVKTSEAFLRVHSKMGTVGEPALLSADTPYERLFESASPAEKAVFEGLSSQLGLTGSARTQAARDGAKKIRNERKSLAGARRRLAKRYYRLREEIADDLLVRWPTLGNLLNPEVTAILTTESEPFLAAVEAHRSHREFQQLYRDMDDIDRKRLSLLHRWAKYRRFVRTAETIVLAVNFKQVASAEDQQGYQQLIDAERGTLQPPRER